MSPEAPKELEKVLMSGYVGEGEKTKEFEKELSNVVENKNILTVNSGTSALIIALRCAGVERGSIVISTPMTCLATNMAILALGAKPYWADVDPYTGLMTRETVLHALNNVIGIPNAILPMHWGGLPCDLDGINSFGIPVVEDACQALGSYYKGKPIGNHSFATCFSFQAIKTLTTVDGGAIAFKKPQVEKRARLMKWFGLDRNISKDMRCEQDPIEFGYKMQMNDVLATIGLCNLKRLDLNLLHMRKHVERYHRTLINNEAIKLINAKDGVSSNWLCTVLVDDSSRFINYMKEKGIECSRVHDRNDTKRVFARYKIDLPGVEYFNDHHVCIPCGWWLKEEEVTQICDALNGYK